MARGTRQASKQPAPEPAASTASAPQVIEGPGRYIVREAPDGGWVVGRAVGLCKNCTGCGCGEQAELIEVPGMVIALAKRQGAGNLLGALGKVAGNRKLGAAVLDGAASNG